MSVWSGEIIISIILSAIAIVFSVLSGDFTAPINPVDIGPAAFPRLMSAVILLLSVAQILLSLRKVRRKDEAETVSFGHWGSCLAALALMCAYAMLMPRLGYYVVTPPVIFAFMFLMGNRKWLRMLLVTAGFTLFAFLVFTTFLGVSLP